MPQKPEDKFAIFDKYEKVIGLRSNQFQFEQKGQFIMSYAFYEFSSRIENLCRKLQGNNQFR